MTIIKKTSISFVAAAIAIFSLPAFSADVVLNIVDAPGVGFNDPTPVAPVAGNSGATLGEQRLIVFQAAADIWGSTVASDAQIVVQATFQPLGCSPTSGVLGSAGTIQIFFDDGTTPGFEPFTWYHSALTNALVGFDVTPGPPDPGLLVPPFNDDIVAFFNGAIGTDPNCLTGLNWYYGLDNNEAGNEIDLLTVVLHEIGHGVGVSEFVSEATGNGISGLPDIYSTNMVDTAQNKTFAEMTPAERLVAQVAGENLVWAGPNVTAAAPSVLGARPTIRILRPKSIAGTLDVQAASFGPSLRKNGGMTGKVVLVNDGVGNSTDGCEAILNNLNGKIALIDRGACAFTTKVLRAQIAGAKGVIVANNQPSGPAPMGGFTPFATIPSVGVSLDQGNAIKSELGGGVNLKLILDKDLLAGADENGFVRLYAPNPVQPGSSKSHFDTSATPNLLMEPAINGDLAPVSGGLDLTPSLLKDIGWTLQ